MSSSVTEMRIGVDSGVAPGGSGVTCTAMPLDSDPGTAAVTTSAGVGSGTGGLRNSPLATRALATASRAVVSAAVKVLAQAGFTCTVEPLNCSADSGTTRCPPVLPVMLIGVEPTTSRVVDIITLRS